VSISICILTSLTIFIIDNLLVTFTKLDRFNGTRSNVLYYYPNVIAHDFDATCTINWITIRKVRTFFFRFGSKLAHALINGVCLFASYSKTMADVLQEIEKTGKILTNVHIQLNNIEKGK